MARRSKRSDLAKLQAKLEVKVNRLEAELREGMIQRIIDLEVVARIRQEKERSQAALEMMDPNKFPLDALEYLQKTILATLTHKGSAPQEEPRRDYIQ